MRKLREKSGGYTEKQAAVRDEVQVHGRDAESQGASAS